MEQGLVAAGIGILIALISYSYGKTAGNLVTTKRSADFADGVKYGTTSVIALLIKSKVINMDISNGYDYKLTGNSNKSVTMTELTELVETNGVGAFNNDSI